MGLAKDDAVASKTISPPEPAKEQPAEKKAKPEKEAGWGDYFRVFTYAKKWDYVLMAAAAVASIGAGIVSPPLMCARKCCHAQADDPRLLP